MHTLPTLSETLTRLKAEGYIEDFNLKGPYLAGERSAIQLAPDEFQLFKPFKVKLAYSPQGPYDV